jgi:hypothetical protein
MKILTTIIFLVITITTNAGRYYHRSYYYYGERDNSGPIVGTIIICAILLFAIIVMFYCNISELSKGTKLTNYLKGNLILTKISEKTYELNILNSDVTTDYKEKEENALFPDVMYSAFVDKKQVYSKRDDFWAPNFIQPKIEYSDNKTLIYKFRKSYNTFHGRYYTIKHPDYLYAYHVYNKLVLTKCEFTLDEVEKIANEKTNTITVKEIIITLIFIIGGIILLLL